MTETNPRTYERQSGSGYEQGHGPRSAEFFDPFDGGESPAVWRPPNEEELDILRGEFDVQLSGLYIAVIDGYQTDHPGYAGALAVVVGGEPTAIESVRLDGYKDRCGKVV